LNARASDGPLRLDFRVLSPGRRSGLEGGKIALQGCGLVVVSDHRAVLRAPQLRTRHG
jgi:hypothetical protein